MNTLTRLNPFRSLPNPREVWAWGMYDLANQSFQLLINTLLFSIYIKNVVATTPARGEQLWSVMVAASLLIIVVISPFVGVLADSRAWKREILLFSGFLCAALTMTFAGLAPGMVVLAACLYIPAAVLCGIGENFLGSFLPEISTLSTVGRISALGWSMSYVGAVLLLAITAAVVILLGASSPMQWRWLFVFCGVWFVAGILPATLFLREKTPPRRALPGEQDASVFTRAASRLADTIRESRHYTQLLRFLAIFFVYSLGTQTVVYFLGLIGDSMGFTIGQLILMALAIALPAGIAAIFAAQYQDRLGHRTTISIFLLIFFLATLALAIVRITNAPAAYLWPVAALLGLGLGGIGTSSRAIVGAFTPPHKAGEFFGLWGTVYKLSGIVGVLAFGQVWTRLGQPHALFMLSAFFLIGLALIRLVNEQRGKADAARSAFTSA